MIYAIYKGIPLQLRIKALYLVLLFITKSAFAQDTCRSHYEETGRAHYIVSTTGEGHAAVARAARDTFDCYGPAWISIADWLYTEATAGLIRSGRCQEARTLANEFFDRYALTADSTSRARLHAQRAAAHYHLGNLEDMHRDYQQVLRLIRTDSYRYPTHAFTKDLDDAHALQDREPALLLDRRPRMNALLYVLATLGIVGVLLVISGVIAHRTGLLTIHSRPSIEAGWRDVPPLEGLTCRGQYHTRDLPETINPDNLRTVQVDRSFYIVLPIIRYESGWDLKKPFIHEPVRLSENLLEARRAMK